MGLQEADAAGSWKILRGGEALLLPLEPPLKNSMHRTHLSCRPQIAGVATFCETNRTPLRVTQQ